MGHDHRTSPSLLSSCLGLSQAIQGFAEVMGKCQVIAYQHLA